MNSRRTFLVSLPLLTAAVVPVNAQKTLTADGVDSGKTVPEIKKSVLFATEWIEGEYKSQKYLFAVADWPSDSESYIDLHGWIYNEYFREWRRFLKVKTRKLGTAKLIFDNLNGVISVRGDANNEFNGAEVLRFDLRATSNDAAAVKQ